ncbi:polysaccharide deacetylase family protein [Cryobacterium sp. Y11]|uniref:polysaccharide deacetylase family protein n=1 Tax=Cryobacterium sp. Y11 TaxID=2045016 RepID=UPI001304DA84|nr:polysaccharide deacetylase family protein [Cryobacterium sp. Y11]
MDTPAETYKVEVILSNDTAFANYARWELLVRPHGGWHFLVGTAVSKSITGTPNLATVSTIRVTVIGYARRTAVVAVGGVLAVLTGKKNGHPNGVLTLAFDDASAGWWTQALPIFNSYGYAATCFVVLGDLDKSGYLTTEQAHALEDVYG